MSTNSNIYKVMADGSIKGIYCHWDGYLEHNGAILDGFYRDPQKVNQLIALGNISALGDNIEPSEAVEEYGFDYYFNEKFQELPEQEQERLKKDSHKHVIAYHRDRAEDLKYEKEHSSLEELRKDIDRLKEFVYVMVPKEGKDASSTNPDDWEWLVLRHLVLGDLSTVITELEPLADILEDAD